MKRTEFIRHLRTNDCELLREGGNHSVFKNTISGKISAIPRHSELKDMLCKKICKDLGIPFRKS